MPSNTNKILGEAIQLHRSGKLTRSVPLYKKILQREPDNIDALHFFGLLQSQLGNYEYSILLMTKAMKILQNKKIFDINYMNINNNIGNVLRSMGRYEESLSAYNNALKIQPDSELVTNNIGLVYKILGEYKKAKNYFGKALGKAPLYIEAIINMGTLCRETGDISGAIDYFERAIELDNNNSVAHSNLALALLSSGDFERGWGEYESRWLGNNWSPRPYNFPVWDGGQIKGKTLLVYAEQGIGDEVMFASCIPDLTSLGANVIIECDPRLEELFRRSFKSVQTIGRNRNDKSLDWLKRFSAIDAQIAIGSLPKLLRPGLESFPRHPGYLVAKQAGIKNWRLRYEQLGRGLYVGISWKGGRSIADRKVRSIVGNRLSPMLNVMGVKFINLQYGATLEDIKSIESETSIKIHHWDDSDPLSNIDDFASQIKALDLVVSIDNSTVHIAGGLAVDTWVLQAIGGDWRWLSNESNSYWYPTVENFWQTTPNQWEAVVQRLADRLKEKVAEKFRL